MTATVAAWREYGAAIIPMPHPSWRTISWLRKNEWFEGDVLPHLRARVAAILTA